jgi:hypothetical protein
LLSNDLIVVRNQVVDHGGHVGHQESAGEPRRCTYQGRDPIQFRISESDLKSNSEPRTTLPLNWCTESAHPPIWTFYICIESYGNKIFNATSLMVN